MRNPRVVGHAYGDCQLQLLTPMLEHHPDDGDGGIGSICTADFALLSMKPYPVTAPKISVISKSGFTCPSGVIIRYYPTTRARIMR
jgi:hypothetical protein